jgi:hypothetical protein
LLRQLQEDLRDITLPTLSNAQRLKLVERIIRTCTDQVLRFGGVDRAESELAMLELKILKENKFY